MEGRQEPDEGLESSGAELEKERRDVHKAERTTAGIDSERTLYQ